MGFIAGFGLTLIVHFYDTMVAGLFCIGIAGGYLLRIFKKEYFFRVLATGLLSIFLAVLPMGIAFLQGTPLQGSLGWGLNVINGSNNTGAEEEDEADIPGSEKEEINTNTQSVTDQSMTESTDTAGSMTDQTMSENGVENAQMTEGTQVKTTRFGMLVEKIRFRITDITQNGLDYLWTGVHNVVMLQASVPWMLFIFGCEGFCLIGGLLFTLIGKHDYGSMLMSAGFGLLL